jgi:hypothetical protein
LGVTKVVRQVHQRIRTIQGSVGNRGTMQLPKQEKGVAWWSPDGAMGTVEGAQHLDAN